MHIFLLHICNIMLVNRGEEEREMRRRKMSREMRGVLFCLERSSRTGAGTGGEGGRHWTGPTLDRHRVALLSLEAGCRVSGGENRIDQRYYSTMW
jgi:hypothetical protein